MSKHRIEATLVLAALAGCANDPVDQVDHAIGCVTESVRLDEPRDEAGGRTALEVLDEANVIYQSIIATVSEPSDDEATLEPQSWELSFGLQFIEAHSAVVPSADPADVEYCGSNGSPRMIVSVTALSVGDVASGPVDHAKLIADDRGWVLTSFHPVVAPSGPLGDAIAAQGLGDGAVSTSLGSQPDPSHQEIGLGLNLHVLDSTANSIAECLGGDGCLTLVGREGDPTPWSLSD